MLMPSERNGPVAASRVVSVSLATLITGCESSDSWIRTAPCTEWVRSCLKGPTTGSQRQAVFRRSFPHFISDVRFVPKRTFAGSPVNYSEPPEKVLQSEILPELKPFKNQRFRCAEVPWVK